MLLVGLDDATDSKITDKMVSEMIRLADKNGDGLIDFTEFISWATKPAKLKLEKKICKSK